MKLPVYLWMLVCQSAALAILPPDSPPLMGWSSWNCFGLTICESQIAEIAEALLQTGLAAAGYKFVNLDDGWAAFNRTADTGELTADSAKFPGGMTALGVLLHGKGLKFGLYTSRATRTCSNAMPGSLGNEDKDAQTFSAFGVDFLKNDDCHVVYANAVKDYGAMERALAQAPRAVFHNTKAPDLNATAAPLVAQYRRVAKDLKNTWEDMVRLVDTGNDGPFQTLPGAGANYFNDFDILEVGNRADANPPYAPVMTLNEWQAHFSLWAAFKSPLIVGNDIRNMTADVLSILTNAEVIAVNQDALGIQARLISRASAGFFPNSKAVVAPCDDTASQQWTLQRDGDTVRLQLVGEMLCLGLWQGQRRWPWWTALSPCNASDPNQAWMWGRNTTVGATLQLPSAGAECWPGVGGEASPTTSCCLVVEGSNPELDGCDWMMDVSRQSWVLVPSKASPGAHTVVSAYSGHCLAVNGGLEVYGGPLAGGNFTVVLFNRSPLPAPVTVVFAGLAALFNLSHFTRAEIRDLWRKENLGVFTANFSASVPSHSALHVTLSPISPIRPIL